jgi:hypothetical protein
VLLENRLPIENLPALRESVLRGGAIVRYELLIGVLALTVRLPRFEWVAPEQSRILGGLKHGVLCFLCGWWSVTGVVRTLGAKRARVVKGLCLLFSSLVVLMLLVSLLGRSEPPAPPGSHAT